MAARTKKHDVIWSRYCQNLNMLSNAADRVCGDWRNGLPPEQQVAAPEFLPVYKRQLLKLAWHPAKHVRDRGYVPFAAPRRLDATLIEYVGN